MGKNMDYQHRTCPNKCGSGISNMSARALINIYNELDIECLTCKKIFKLETIEKHESQCGRSKCQYFQFCNGYLTKGRNELFCSQKCSLVHSLIPYQGDDKKVYGILKDKIEEYSKKQVSSAGKMSIKWSTKQCWMNIVASEEDTALFLKEDPYVFRTVFTSAGFTSGKHYWQIHPDNRTENEVKIGITLQTQFNLNTAFCDYPFGYGFYGLGQLRNGSNAAGPFFGRRFKKTGVLGIYLNMDVGELYFCLNGEDFGLAFKTQKLTKGPIYPAVALLHCSGCTIKGELPIPKIYQNK